MNLMTGEPIPDTKNGFGPYDWPPDPAQIPDLIARASSGFATAQPSRSARRSLSPAQKGILALVACLAFPFALAPTQTGLAVLGFLWTLAWISIALRHGPVLQNFFTRPPEAPLLLAGEDLPVYSVLVPLLRETQMLPRLLRHLAAVDYPSDRLDIMLLIEETDAPMCEALAQLDLPDHFTAVIVPFHPPYTKPKACNYGLLFARGDYVVIYDAEDIPHPLQLRLAASRFARAPEQTACLQAPLDFETENGNWLGLQAAMEYYLQFHFFLPFCVRIGLPVLLGGTSNHFRIKILRALKGWDAWNVTEDAELGLRLAANGYQVEMLPAPTSELPCRNWRDWHRQRARWIKGWLLTYFAYMRRADGEAAKSGLKIFLATHILIFCQMAAIISFPVLFICLLLFLLGFWFSLPPMLGFFLNLNIFYGLITASIIIACHMLALRHGPAAFRPALALTSPFYWLLAFPAFVRACRQLVFAPHRWDKTPHAPVGADKAQPPGA